MKPKSEQIKNKIEVVKNILERIPESRDNDNILLINFWKSENAMVCNFGTVEVFFRELVNERFTFPETITRVRRLVQKKHPELMGKNQLARMEAKEEVKQNINK